MILVLLLFTQIYAGHSTLRNLHPGSPTFDMLTWLLPDPKVMAGKHLTGNANPIYGIPGPAPANGKPGMFWWVKGKNGWPADVELYDNVYIYHWATELNWTSNKDYKATFHATTIPFAKRFSSDGDFVLSTDSTIGVYQNCSLTKTFVLGDVRIEVHDASIIDLGGDLGKQHALKVYYRWGGQGHKTGIYNVEEVYTFAKPYGQVGWSTAKWNGSSYSPPSQVVVFNKIASGTVVPNFPACPNLP